MSDPNLLSSKDVQDCKPIITKLEAMDILVLEKNELRVMEEYRRIRECENLEMKERLDDAKEEIIFLRKFVGNLIMGIFTLLLFLILLPWRAVPSLLQWCLAVFFIFSQVSDKSVIVHEEGKTNFSITMHALA